MRENYVSIRIKATDGAKPDLAGLKADLDELGSKVVSAKVDVDDKDGTARLLSMNARLAALNAKVANPKITLAGAARAEADIAALKAQMDGAGKSSVGLKSRLMALGGTATTVAGVGDVFGLFNKDAGMASKAMSGFSLATGLLEAPLSGLIVGVGGLAAGLVAAGAGLGVFGLVAKSNLTAASTAATAVQTAQTAYNSAIATGTKHSTAYAAEQKAILSAYAQLSPAQVQLSKNIGSAQNSWQSFVQSNTSGVSKILSQGIGLLPKIFQSMQPFMAPVEKALGGLVGQLGKGLDSSGFKSFIAMLAGGAGPAITKLGQSVGHIAVGLGGVIRAFMPFAQVMLSGLDKVTAKFAQWGTTLTSHSGFQSLTSMAQKDMPLVIEIVKNLGGAVKNVASAMAGLSTASNSTGLLKLAAPLSQMVNWLSQANPELLNMGLYALAAGGAIGKMKPVFQGVKAGLDVVKGGASAFQDLSAGFSNSAAAASSATGVWGTVGGKISTAVTAIKGWGIWSKVAAAATRVWTGIQAAFDVVMDANPIVLIVIAIAALIAAIVLITMHSKAFRDFWKAAWHEIASVFDTVRHAIAKGFDFITSAASKAFGWVKGHWPLLLAILTGPIGLAVLFIVRHWDQILSGAQHMIGSLVSWFAGLPGRILAAIGDLGSLLYKAGVQAIKGLISGAGSMIGSGVSTLEGWGHDLASAITSPFGIHLSEPSEAAIMIKAGKNIPAGLAKGVRAGMPDMSSTMAKVAGMVTGRAGGAAGYGGGAGGRQQLEVLLTMSNNALLKAMQVTVREAGGDPVMFQKKVAYR